MSVRFGIAVAADAVRAVAVRDGRVRWAVETPVGERALQVALAELLATAKLPRWPQPTIVAAVGPAVTQTRRLAGLPAVADAAALAQVVRQASGRFFLKNGIPLVTTGVRRDGDDGSDTGGDTGWAAAFEEPVVRALVEACRARGVRLAAVVPTVAVLPRALEGDAITWRDGEVRSDVALLADGRLAAVRRALDDAAEREGVHESEHEPPRPRAPLAALGADGWRFADAYGAAVTSAAEPLAFHPTRDARGATKVPRWRLVLAGAAATIALVALLVVPGLVAARSARVAAGALAALARPRAAAVADEADLRRVTGALAEVDAFGRDRRSATLFLAALARALPERSALVALRTDSAGGTLVALAPRAAMVLGRLERVPGVATPSIVGPVTREVAAGAEVERVTIHFRWADRPAPARAPGSNRR